MKQLKKYYFLSIWLVVLFNHSTAQNFLIDKKKEGSVSIASDLETATIYVDKNDDKLVNIAALLLQSDIERVTGIKPAIVHSLTSEAKDLIIIGSISKSTIVQELIGMKKIDVSQTRGKWEAYLLQTVIKPFKQTGNALVIAGSDRRGTAYGVLELSQQIGVSPWYWWADVPVNKKTSLYIKKDLKVMDMPAVKYRGIFINDEAPALSNWSKEKFGGFNHRFYEKVFELILRLKGNYLWPAMWGNAFYDDDSLNKQSADDYGIVIGTSHHEPLMRAHDEWRRYGKGKWNYDSNETRLKDFWKGGLQRAAQTEKIVSIGMRGDGDEPMTQGTAIALLERIVKDQRELIEEVTGKPAAETPQLWALYKEVQDYYDKGMRVPDDVTLLLCDDNWGNIRKLPKLNEKPRKGGYGIYYHFDYVGGPRNYKWINTNNITRVWEQMHLAWEYNAREIWIVNVGDIKPMELPISFFLDYAWNPEKIKAEDIPAYHERWAAQQFGEKHAKDIGYILRKYGQYSSRRKPELLSPSTYTLVDYTYGKFYSEWDWVVEAEWFPLNSTASVLEDSLPPEYKDAYFQLVTHPVAASHEVNVLYRDVALNHFYAKLKSETANLYAQTAWDAYFNDSLLTKQYHTIANGKWNHMMSQTHIGYTYWQQPPVNKMPELKYVSKDSIIKTREEAYIDKSITAKKLIPTNRRGNIFYEQDGYVSMEASHFTKAVNSNNINWKILPDIGKTGDGITTFPVTANVQQPGYNSPHLQYEVYVYDTGIVKVQAYFSTTLNFHNKPEGLQYAASIDDEEPQIISLNKEDKNVRTWENWVANNIIIKTSTHTISKPGKHVLKFWMVDPAVVLQKLVMDFGGVKPSYLGPPETRSE